MPWALNSFPGSGAYSPDGDFIGRKEQLESHFERMPKEVQEAFDDSFAAYALHVAHKFNSEIGTIVGGPPPLTPIEPHEVPQVYRTRKTYPSLASFLQLRSSIVAVDVELKAIIERLEPGVHQFFPLQITMPRGRPYPKTYYTLVIGQFLESFLPEQSSPRCIRNIWPPSDFYSIDVERDCCPNLAFSRTAAGHAHLWRERKTLMKNILISDALQAEIAAAGLRIWKHWRVKEVLP